LSNQKNGDLASERFPSGQRGQTVNLLAMPSEVRILPSPPGQPGANLLKHSSSILSSPVSFRKKSGVNCSPGIAREASEYHKDGTNLNLSGTRKKRRFDRISFLCTGGSSSVGRASAFQAEGRGFDPRFPLHFIKSIFLIGMRIYSASLSC
jgi:hypothetical protein